MKKKSAGFSLIEVALALGVIVFGLVTMLGVFPMGLDDSRTSVKETRGAQMARAVFSTLQTPSFNAVDCYGQTLDLSSLDTSSTPVLLYAKFSDPAQPTISSTRDSDSIYTLELRFNQNVTPAVTPVTLKPMTQGTANLVTLTIYAQTKDSGTVQFATVIGDY